MQKNKTRWSFAFAENTMSAIQKNDYIYNNEYNWTQCSMSMSKNTMREYISVTNNL